MTTSLRDSYKFRVTFSQEDNEYVGLCSEFPSLSWLAPTADDALFGIETLVRDVVVDMTARGGLLPACR